MFTVIYPHPQSFCVWMRSFHPSPHCTPLSFPPTSLVSLSCSSPSAPPLIIHSSTHLPPPPPFIHYNQQNRGFTHITGMRVGRETRQVPNSTWWSHCRESGGIEVGLSAWPPPHLYADEEKAMSCLRSLHGALPTSPSPEITQEAPSFSPRQI